MSTVRAVCLQPWFGAGVAHLPVADLCLHSRHVAANDLFFALSAPPVLQQHVDEAVARGAVAVVVDETVAGSVATTVPVLVRPALRAALGDIAAAFYANTGQDFALVGVTGTNGKTTCTHWLAQAAQLVTGRPAGVMGTLGVGLVGEKDWQISGLTTADVLSNHRALAGMRAAGATLVAMEVSSHSLEQGRVDALPFATAVFTNLTRDHLDYHGDMQAYGAAKRKLFERHEVSNIIINSDDAFGKTLCDQLQAGSAHLLRYGIADGTADLGVERCEVTGRGIVASIRTPWGKGALRSRFPGGYNLLNALAVVGTLCAHGMRLQTVLDAMEQLQAVPGRTQIVSDDNDDVQVVVDYAHTPDALRNVLGALREQPHNGLWCVFGCGGNRDAGKRPQMAAMAEQYADYCVVTTDNPRDENPVNIMNDIVMGFARQDFQLCEDRAKAIAFAIEHAAAGAVVLLAGKGHEDYQEIAGERRPFSDVVCARQALAARRARLRAART